MNLAASSDAPATNRCYHSRIELFSYNHKSGVLEEFAMISKRFALVLLIAAIVIPLINSPRNVTAQGPAGDVVLVLPFENTSNHPEYNWIGESFADSLSSLLSKPGMVVVTTGERAVTYQRLRLPPSVLPSRATAIKIARELKATMIVVGTYNVTLPAVQTEKSKDQSATPAATIAGEARVIRVNEGRMSGDVFDGAWAPRIYDFADDIKALQSMQGRLAYQILFQRDKALPFSQTNLIQEATKAPPLAFEALMKGLLTPEREPIREIYLKNAMRLYAKDNGGAVYPQAAFELGRFYLAQGKLKEAAEYFSMVQKKEPHYGEAQFYAALAYWKIGDLQPAMAALVPLATEMPLVGVYNNAGAVSIEVARAEKKPDERTRLLAQGITLLSRAADSSPDDTMVLFNYGYALFVAEKYNDAAEKLQRVIAADPHDGQAYFLLAKALERAGSSEAANAADNQSRKYLQTYAKWQTEWQKSQSITAINLRARDVLNQIDVADIDKSRAAEAAAASSAQESLSKIRDLYQQGRDDDAMTELRKLMIMEPTNAEAFLLSGKINQRRGDQESAIAALKTAVFWESTHPLIEAHILLGRIFLERGDLGEARKYAASAMTIDPNNPEALALQRQVTMGKP
jgi:predicted Zn-dependent protease